MSLLLRKLFIKDYQNTKDEHVRASYGKVAALFGIIINIVLIILKATIAILLFTQSGILSAALLADCVNNVSDASSSIVSLVCFKMATKPADEKHPFGHERVEYVAALIISVIVVVVGVQLMTESITKIIGNERAVYDLTAVIVLAVSVLLKIFQAYVNFSFGKIIDSDPLRATALDSTMDIIATTAILVSGILSMTAGYDFLDGYMGAFVSLTVIISGGKMVMETSSPLIGEPIEREFIEEVESKALNVKGVLGVHDIICHQYGPTRRFISLDVEVNSALSLTQAHEISEILKRELEKEFKSAISVHLDPVEPADEKGVAFKNEVISLVEKMDENARIHDFRFSSEDNKTVVSFDILVPHNSKLTSDKALEKLGELYPELTFEIGIDHPFSN